MIGQQAVLVLVAEHRGHREVFALRDRIILVVVTAGALHRQAHETVAGGHHAVIDAVLSELLGDRAAFERHAMQPVEGRRHALVLGRRRQQVAGELFRQELVVRLIFVEGLEHPVPPRPGEHGLVAGVAPGVGIAREIQPADREMFSEARRSQHRVDALLICVGGIVGEERGDFFGGGRQPGQREGSAAEQGGAVGGGRRTEAFLGRGLGDESIQRVPRPGRFGDWWGRVRLRAHEGPVRIVFRALSDPADQDVFLRLGERAMQFRRRHHVFLIFAQDALHEGAVFKISWRHRHITAFQFLRRPGKFIET